MQIGFSAGTKKVSFWAAAAVAEECWTKWALGLGEQLLSCSYGAQ